MKTNIAFALAPIFLSVPIHALDISGKVVDKTWRAIPDAKVCIQYNTVGCVNSGPDGSYRIQGTVAVTSGADQEKKFSLDFLRGSFQLFSPQGMHAQVEWLDPEGRRLGSIREMELSPGRNAIAAPEVNGANLVFMRLTGAGIAVTWKALLQGKSGGTASGMSVSGNGEIGFAALSKVAAVGSLVVTKGGYATATFQPSAETETGDDIVLGGLGETVTKLFDGKTLAGWTAYTKGAEAPGTWDVQDSALHSKGTMRGTLNTDGDYQDYRVIFWVRHPPVTGNDHAPCTLIWCYRTPLYDAAGGVQFQVPNGGHWDYRPTVPPPGKPNTGNPNNEFTTPNNLGLDNKVWSQCEILARGATGKARMACCTLTGNGPCKGVENLDFNDKTASRSGPFALQTHNSGLHDEYKNITMEVNPLVDDLITTK